MKPKLPLTVSEELWDDMARSTSPEFADSYLSGARERSSTLLPHTVTAYERLLRDQGAKRCFQRRGLTLVKPLPFGHPERRDSHDAPPPPRSPDRRPRA